ncbi:DUF4249 domain-containing protein [Pseudochryseolinea flava]|uniref:DUF4249 domain-containing protein n=1 Tax=Pseudochryseolinea flava TaxID=2059302 RepID=A0A364Y0S8_9BACT|nr:DUF4249 domain-containing protein [Pseudochryseolinea flava]RAV99872.1 DUF4249 domain-containing protein [Pseudochryseolinea flava]
MTLRNYYIIIIVALSLAFTSCVDPYATPESNQNIDILVVDGFLDIDNGTVNVTLSKAINLSSPDAPPAVVAATVHLEDSDNNILPLGTTTTVGLFRIDGLTIDQGKQYRIRIKTADKEYLSDFITPTPSPEIDSVTWRASDDGVTVHVNTHDNSGKSRYYQWTFDETYEYTAPLLSPFIIVDTTVVPRPVDEQVFTCWRTLGSTNIAIGSSFRLEDDIIQQKAVHFIPKGDVKLSKKYSILVRQTVLSREAYDFWLNLQQTTEQLGGLFDPQPGKVVGNIHSINGDKEPVLGYFGGGQIKEKRLFIKHSDLPENLRVPRFSPCEQDTVMKKDLPLLDRSYYITSELREGPVVLGYTYTTRSCADCRVDRGIITKPTFWE